ncbi:MAG TPA: coenzyme F420-0:L-glutamate ligase [Patescibacteria group bacterium]|nr:coenzyme F420-0:L-glutamate ligase [Patescibacteria group bacterium]
MNIRAIKTHKITDKDKNLLEVLDKYITELSENSVVVVTSKIVSICEGNFVPMEGNSKDELIKKEADLYLPREENKYNLFLTIKNNVLAVSAGIDESNTDGNYVLWPVDLQSSANKVREHLTDKFSLKNVGVIITDSKTSPLRWGVGVISLAHSGFKALNDMIGTPDIFGRKLKMTKVAIADGLAASAGLVMGESAEQTPIAIVSDVPFVEFQDRNPTADELGELRIDIDDDVYSPILRGVDWKKGTSK